MFTARQCMVETRPKAQHSVVTHHSHACSYGRRPQEQMLAKELKLLEEQSGQPRN